MGNSLRMVKKTDLEKPYSLCGKRTYLIGFQNGLFPELGLHLKGKMGGLWIHPMRVLQGFWMGLRNEDEIVWLGKNCEKFTFTPYHSEHHYSVNESKIVRRTFVPEWESGIAIDISLSDLSLVKRFYFLVGFDIRPVWFSDEVNGQDVIRYEEKSNALIARDTSKDISSWSGALVCDKKPVEVVYDVKKPDSNNVEYYSDFLEHELQQSDDLGVYALMIFDVTGREKFKLNLAISGSTMGEGDALSTCKKILEDKERLANQQKRRYDFVAKNLTEIKTPNKNLDIAFHWSKINLEMLTYYQPGIGTGVVAGHPDFPWFFGCDTAYTIYGLLASGLHETAKSSLKLLANVAEKQGGRVPHEIVTNGKIYNPGDVEESPLFVRAVKDVYSWTGDINFLKELYPICKKAIYNFTLACDDDHDLLPSGPGIAEYPGRERGEKIDVACDLYQAFLAIADMAKTLGDSSIIDDALEKAEKLKDNINKLYWSEEKCIYADNLSENHLPEFNRIGTIIRPLETMVAPDSYAEKILNKIESPEFTGEWGFYIDPRKKMVMPHSNGLLSIAEFNYNRPEKGMYYLGCNVSILGKVMPGAISELSPDKGCCLQAWSSAMVLYPLIYGLLMPRVDVRANRIEFSPWIPKDWNGFQVRKLRVGNVFLDLKIKRKGKSAEISFVKKPRSRSLSIKLKTRRIKPDDDEEIINFDLKKCKAFFMKLE